MKFGGFSLCLFLLAVSVNAGGPFLDSMDPNAIYTVIGGAGTGDSATNDTFLWFSTRMSADEGGRLYITNQRNIRVIDGLMSDSGLNNNTNVTTAAGTLDNNKLPQFQPGSFALGNPTGIFACRAGICPQGIFYFTDQQTRALSKKRLGGPSTGWDTMSLQPANMSSWRPTALTGDPLLAHPFLYVLDASRSSVWRLNVSTGNVPTEYMGAFLENINCTDTSQVRSVGAPATSPGSTVLCEPSALYLDSSLIYFPDSPQLFIADQGYNVLRRVNVPTNEASVVAGNGQQASAFAPDGAPANSSLGLLNDVVSLWPVLWFTEMLPGGGRIGVIPDVTAGVGGTLHTFGGNLLWPLVLDVTNPHGGKATPAALAIDTRLNVLYVLAHDEWQVGSVFACRITSGYHTDHCWQVAGLAPQISADGATRSFTSIATVQPGKLGSMGISAFQPPFWDFYLSDAYSGILRTLHFGGGVGGERSAGVVNRVMSSPNTTYPSFGPFGVVQFYRPVGSSIPLNARAKLYYAISLPLSYGSFQTVNRAYLEYPAMNDDTEPIVAHQATVTGGCVSSLFGQGGIANSYCESAPLSNSFNLRLEFISAISFDYAYIYIAVAPFGGDHVIFRIDTGDDNFAATLYVGYYGGGTSYNGDGPSLTRQLNNPSDIHATSHGLYIADTGNNRIRRATGTLTGTVAGSGALGPVSNNMMDALDCALNGPMGVYYDTYSYSLYIADTGHNRVMKVDQRGNIYRVAGMGAPFASFGFSPDGTPAINAALNRPRKVFYDEQSGGLLIADTDNNVIRAVKRDSGSRGLACDPPCLCTDAEECSNLGNASGTRGVACACTCFSGFMGPHCDQVCTAVDSCETYNTTCACIQCAQGYELRHQTCEQNSNSSSSSSGGAYTPEGSEQGDSPPVSTGGVVGIVIAACALGLFILFLCHRQLRHNANNIGSAKFQKQELVAITTGTSSGTSGTGNGTVVDTTVTKSKAYDNAQSFEKPLILQETSSATSSGSGSGGSRKSAASSSSMVANSPPKRRFFSFLRRATKDVGKQSLSEGGNRAKEIDPDDITFAGKIGEGVSGVVYKAVWHGAECAAKLLRNQENTDTNVNDFRNEVQMAVEIGSHPRVIQLLGACSIPPHMMIVMSYMPYGSVEQLLIHSPIPPFSVDWSVPEGKRVRNIAAVVQMAVDASAGVLHLHSQGLLHRDVAARNFLVDSLHRVSISDFGMTHKLAQGQTMYVAPKTETIAIRWASPETLVRHEYSAASDVYSVGVYLWEIIAQTQPYAGLNQATDVAPHVVKSDNPLRPVVPDFCPKVLADLMRDCWAHNPIDRPTAVQVNRRLMALHTALTTGNAAAIQDAAKTVKPQPAGELDKRQRGVDEAGNQHVYDLYASV